MWGAGGLGSTAGNGAYVEGILDVTPGQQLSLTVGQRGDRTQSYGGGGVGGGGRSAIRYLGASDDIVTAGGGGGGIFGGSATAYDPSTNQMLVTSYRGGNDIMTTECSGVCTVVGVAM